MRLRYVETVWLEEAVLDRLIFFTYILAYDNYMTITIFQTKLVVILKLCFMCFNKLNCNKKLRT